MNPSIAAHETPIDILFSVLNFNSEDRTITLLSHIVRLVHDKCILSGLSYNFVIRDNSPTLSKYLIDKISELASEGLRVFYTSSSNVGFGAGTNLNFQTADSSVFCIMNNDMAFPHVDWLDDVFNRLRSDPTIGAIGLEEENFRLNHDFGNAHRILSNLGRSYLDGSLLLINSHAFRQIGGFDDAYGLAYFEDTDFSFRLRGAGYRLEVASMPHQHFRSSSTSKLPPSFYSSIYEKSRSVFFSRWGDFLQHGLCSNRVLIVCNHDGIGDFFLCLYPLREFLRRAARLGFFSTVQVKYRELGFLLGGIENTEIVFSSPMNVGHFVRTINLSGLNMALPVLSLDLFAAQLGVVDFDDDPTELKGILLNYKKSSAFDAIGPGNYVACHFDNTRSGFAGRVIGRQCAKEVLKALLESEDKIVLLGGNDSGAIMDRDYEEYVRWNPRILDLRGKTSILELIQLVAFADRFVGIDSGPANIAQAFAVESLLIYGSTLPETKVYRNNVNVFVNRGLTCLGCYHSNVEYSYNTCFRIDEACVRDINPIELARCVSDFLSDRKLSSPADGRYRVRLREHIMLLIYNPLYRSKSYSLTGFIGKNFADSVIELVDNVARRATAESAGIRDIAFKLEKENRELKTKLSEVEKVLSWASTARSEFSVSGGAHGKMESGPGPGTYRNGVGKVSPDDNSTNALTASRGLKLLPSKNGFVGCDAQIHGETVTVNSNGPDPQIFLKPIRLTGSAFKMEFSARADILTKLQIFWAVGGATFREMDSVEFAIGPTMDTFRWNAPAKPGDILFLRLDPADAKCEVVLSLRVGGEFREGTSFDVRRLVRRVFAMDNTNSG